MRGEYLVVAAKQKLAIDPRVGRNDLILRSHSEHEVLVTGEVESLRQQEAINEVLMEIPEIKGVINHTHIRVMHAPHAPEQFPPEP